ncbi:MAG: hypothetical protein RBT75_05265 [Anaerolineae bacterium]|jgi:hypothetical protein|nr:hypothetical protein [Anaerolineae bacterium]
MSTPTHELEAASAPPQEAHRSLERRPLERRPLERALRWNRSSTVLLSAFLLTLGVIVYVWWPLAQEVLATFDPRYPWWVQMDWLLVGNFLVMSLLLVLGADLRTDALVVLVGLAGGLAIEGWGTQTEIWTYYTLERPPLWIIPAWPIASLSIDRLVRLLHLALPPLPERAFSERAFYERARRWSYALVFGGFYALMLAFTWHTLDKSLTLLALAACALMILSPTDRRLALLTFGAGAGLGYFLELWGTTRECWTYYTLQQPPLFAVLAHGMAAVALWRTGLLLRALASAFGRWYSRRRDMVPST